MTEQMEYRTPIDEIIQVLESYKKGGILDTGAQTPLQGFNQAIRIIRALQVVHYTNDAGDRLLNVFEEYVHSLHQTETFRILKCSSCGQAHGDQKMILWKGEGSKRYWGLCPTLRQVFFHFVEE